MAFLLTQPDTLLSRNHLPYVFMVCFCISFIGLRTEGAECCARGTVLTLLVLQVATESRDPVLKLKLKDMLAEQQSVDAPSEESTEHPSHTT